MIFRKFAISAALAAAAFSAQIAAQDAPPEVQSLANRWTAAYNEADVPALASLYADNAELYIHEEGRFIGRESIRDYWAADMSRFNPITVLNVTDSVVDSEMMLVHGNYQVLDRNSGVPLGGGRFAHIWVLDADGWVLDRDVWVDTRR